MFTNLALDLVHGLGILLWLKSLVSTYAQWFWGLSILASDKEKHIPGVQLTVMASATVLSLVVILQLIGLVPSHGGFYGILSQPFTSSGLLLISFFISLSYKAFDQRWLSASLLLQLLAIFALGQRSVWLGFLLAIVIYLILSKEYKNKFVWISLVAMTLVGSFVVSQSPRVEHKIQRFVNPNAWLKSKTFTMRQEIWRINYEAWRHRPIVGTHKVVEHDGLKHVHNIYLQQLVTGGVVKFVAWLAFFVFTAWFLFQHSLALFSAFVALSVEGLLENWWGDSEVLSLFFLILVLASLILIPQKVK